MFAGFRLVITIELLHLVKLLQKYNMKLKDSVLGSNFSLIVVLLVIFVFPFLSLSCSWYAELIIIVFSLLLPRYQ